MKFIHFNLKVGAFLGLFFFFIIGCKKQNHGSLEERWNEESISRWSDDCLDLSSPRESERGNYPWEGDSIRDLQRITKDFFCCRGNCLNPPRLSEDGRKVFYDCEGAKKHSLPFINDKEGVYPILIELLNALQIKMNKKVIITCGHRCPLHNSYTDPKNPFSKHQIGAEVDFYVQGMEDKPEEVVQELIDCYQRDLSEEHKKEYGSFFRYDQSDRDMKTLPWFNKELLIKLYLPYEGRDGDNHHPFPYICIQVCYDRETGKEICFSDRQARYGYKRW